MRSPRLPDLPPPPPGRTGWPWTEETPPLPDATPDGRPWPRITIVTPSFNQGGYLEETIRSVLLQGYPELEYIVMDGGSADGSVEVLRRYDRWLASWSSEPDEGQADALNKGFRRATGSVFAYLNSDDLYAPGALARAARDFARDPAPTWHAYPVRDFSEAGPLELHVPPVISFRRMPAAWTPRDADTAALLPWVLGRVHLHQPGVFWSSGSHRAAGGFDAAYHYAFDRKLFMALVAAGHPLRLHGGEPAALFRIHGLSKTGSEGRRAAGNPFASEEARISRELERHLRPAERWIAQRARAELGVSEVWAAYGGRRDAPKCLLRLLALAADAPAALGSRFYWGALKEMVLRSAGGR